MESLVKFFNHDFGNGPFCLFDKEGNNLYIEYENGYWEKKEFDEHNNMTYFGDSTGHQQKWRFDINNNLYYFEDSSNGIIVDRRSEMVVDKSV